MQLLIRNTGYSDAESHFMFRYDATATSLVDVSNILEQPTRCILMADNEDVSGRCLRNIRTYETTRCHIKEGHK